MSQSEEGLELEEESLEYIDQSNKDSSDLNKSINSNSTEQQKKRTTLACTNCRKRHIKCDGNGKQCSRCVHLKYECIYQEAEKKVVISVKYLNQLQNQISKLKVENANLRSFNKSSLTENKHAKSLPNNQIYLNANTVEDGDKRSGILDDDSKQSLDNTRHDGNRETYGAAINHSGTKRRISELNYPEDDVKNSKSHEIIPPFLEKYGRMIHSRTGERLYVGSSSMTLFGLEINRLVAPLLLNNNNCGASPESVSSNHENETILEKEGNAYRIMLGKTRSRPGIDVNFTLPSYSYAMLLVDSFISYNDGCFYFFNEGLVKENLRRIYNDDTNTGFKLDYGIDSLNSSPQNESTLETIWFCKLLLIFAIGEMYLGTANFLNGYKLNERTKRKKHKMNRQKSSETAFSNDSKEGTNGPNTEATSPNSSKKSKTYAGTKLPGSGFFNQASDLFTGLFASGSIDNCIREGGIEVLLLYAFYLQVADCTAASYFYFGIALRASLLLGLHVDIGKDTLNRFELEHRRRIWWTVYMYERMLASKAGLPLSLTDEDISTELPNDFDMSDPVKGCENYIFPEAEFISNCVKITKINANILRKLYNRQPSSNILPVVHELVVSLLRWKKALPNDINCDYSQENLDISRLVVNMMTEYFQGINLAVRPLLFHFVLVNLKSGNPKEGQYLDLSQYSSVILALLNASFQGSINTIRSLWALVPENMVALFGYMDREYLFNATATLVLFNATFGVYDATKEHIDHALSLFTKMRNLGNHPATLRREQILKLLSLLDFNGTMSDLINKHNDNLNAPSSSANLDKSFGHQVSVGNKPKTLSSEFTAIAALSDLSNNTHLNITPDVSTNPIADKIPQESEYMASKHDQTMHTASNLFTSFIQSSFPNDQNPFTDEKLNDKSAFGTAPIIDNSNNKTSSHTHIVNFPGHGTGSTPTLAPFSPSLSLMFNQIDDIPEFEQLSSTGPDMKLWKDVTDQAAWLQNNMDGELGQLFEKNEKH